MRTIGPFYRGVHGCGYMLGIRIRVDNLDPIAEATFSSYLHGLHDADWQRLTASWQDLSVNP